jgi:hypothetical protein
MSQSFDIFLAEFAAAKGLQVEPGTYALEFESDDHQVVVMPHPAHPERLMVEVSVAELGQDGLGVELAPLLLQINEVARFEHDWSIFMDSVMSVSIGTCLPLSGLSMGDVEALIVDGLDRAHALVSLLRAQAQQALNPQTADDVSKTPEVFAPESQGFLRG